MEEPRRDTPIRRRPVASAAPSFHDSPSLAPAPPLPLRPSRSATNLHSVHEPPETGIVDVNGELLVDFVVEELPSPAASMSLSPTPYRSLEVRRVKSSSALPTSQGRRDSQPKDPSKWKTALGEAQYFAGGLVSRPAESTRHYSVIRHSGPWSGTEAPRHRFPSAFCPTSLCRPVGHYGCSRRAFRATWA